MDDLEIIKEFLIESSENLARLDNELVELERRPDDRELLASIFRTVHTIKGTCGFFGFSTLGSITHEAETILAQLRDGKRAADADTVSLILETVDATRAILKSIEERGEEGSEFQDDLVARLRQAATGEAPAPAKPAPAPVEPPPPPPPAVPEPQEPPASEAAAASVADSAIRVDVGLLGKLMNLVGELVLVRNRILQSAQAEGVALSAAAQRLNLITTELQEGVMKTRMQPIGGVWGKLPRATRDIARSLGKQIRLETDGAETELDKTIIEAIKDPLTHLVRNSCDHGIERPEERLLAGKPAQGRIRLRAYHEGGQVNIEIIDDGGGIDTARLRRKAVERGILRQDQADRMSEREALHLVFHPGFSTAESVTSVSGRGVGMDVVKSNIERIGGVVDLASQRGEGTTVRLKIPLTLAIIPGLVVTSGGERFVVPQVSLLELMRLDGAQQIEWVHGTPVFRRRGTLLPVAFLNDVLRLGRDEGSGAGNLIVLQAEDRQFGLVVDAINDTQEIVVKPLGAQLKRLPVYAGATIMGDGRVALILDVAGVAQSAGVFQAAATQSMAADGERKAAQVEAQRLLLFRAGSFERLAVPLSLVARLEEFAQASIERAGGHPVVQYRGRLLPLLSLASLLDGFASGDATRDPAQVVVFQDNQRTIGVLVDQVIDIVEETVSLRRQSANPYLLGSGVVGGKVVDFLNLQAVLEAAGAEWSGQRAPRSVAPTVVLAEASPFSRGLLRGGLESAGYQVLEAANAPEVLRLLDHSRADVVVASLDLPPEGGHALLDAMRRQADLERLPALALTDNPAACAPRADGEPDFDDYQAKSDWQAMVGSVERLCAALSEGAPLPGGTGVLP